MFESRIGEPNSSSMPSRSSVSSMTIPRRMACDLSQVGSDHDAAAERPQAARERNALVAARRGTPWGQVLRCNAARNALGQVLRCNIPPCATRRGTPGRQVLRNAWGLVLRCNILLLRQNVMLRCKT